jgi:hypothetical protein
MQRVFQSRGLQHHALLIRPAIRKGLFFGWEKTAGRGMIIADYIAIGVLIVVIVSFALSAGHKTSFK